MPSHSDPEDIDYFADIRKLWDRSREAVREAKIGTC
jgi:hypothetical protein